MANAAKEWPSEVADGTGLRILFQPVVDLDGRTIAGYEAFARGPEGSPLAQPRPLLEAARASDSLAALECTLADLAAERFEDLGLSGNLFFNVAPEGVLDPTVRASFAASFQDLVARRRVVLELTAGPDTTEAAGLAAGWAALRGAGFMLALDNFGGAGPGLRDWWALRPDIIKVDREYVSGLIDDPVREQLLRTLAGLARAINSQVVATGVEDEATCAILRTLGIGLAQGFLFGRPRQLPVRHAARRIPNPEATAASATPGLSQSTIADIVRPTITVSPTTLVEVVGEMFRTTMDLQLLPVIDERRPAGVVERNGFMQVFASRYGRELYGRRPISGLMKTDTVIVEASDPVESVSQLLTEVQPSGSEYGFMVTSNGEYVGIATILDLLRRITELRVNAARYANPLTLLPGNVPIAETVDGLLQQGRSFAVVYADIDNFKPFNDYYGYGRGDDVIRLTAQLLVAAVDPERDFVGHVGGDDFIAVFQSPDWRDRCLRVLADFDAGRDGFYEPAELEAGGMTCADRRGNLVFYELVTLSMGAVELSPEKKVGSAQELAVVATEAKSQAKLQTGSTLFVDRRAGD